MKMPLDWHRTCLDQYEKNFERKEAELKEEILSLNRWRVDLEFYKKQLIEAERKGKDGFDRYKFLKPKKGG